MEMSDRLGSLRVVARSNQTAADRDLIAHARLAGFAKVTARKLEDWRRAGAMPARVRLSLGRYGTVAVDSPEAQERLVALCQFLYKAGAMPERADLPRRRRIADALLYLWLEGFEVSTATVRDLVCDRLIALDERLASRRAAAARDHPEWEEYEVSLAASEEAVESMANSDVARNQRLALRPRRKEFDGRQPRELAAAAGTQVMQAIQGHVDLETGLVATLLESPLAGLAADVAPVMSPAEEEQVARELAVDSMVRAVWACSEGDWNSIRAAVQAVNETTIALRNSPDAELRGFACRMPVTNTRGSLATAIARFAAKAPELEEALRG